MKIKSFTEILQAAGLAAPSFDALIPNDQNYTAMLFQPQGDIEGDPSGVRNHNRDRAVAQFSRFLQEAVQRQAELAVTPEYSLPWDVLIGAIKSGATPGPGKLWVLGCESIKYAELSHED